MSIIRAVTMKAKAQARHAGHPHEKPHHPHWPLAALLFLFVLALGLSSVHDPATWIHIRTGAMILAQKAVPLTDPFSYTVAGRAWTTDSWLGDVLFYLVHENLGPRALILLKSAAAAAGFALLLPLNYASPLTSAGVLAVGALAAWTGLAETPAVFDLPLLALMLRLLRPRTPFRARTLLSVAGLVGLWANLHGAAAALGVWIAALKAFKASMRASNRKERLGHWGLLAAAVAGLLLNPHGARVLGRLFNGAQASLTAWQAPSALLNLGVLFALAGAAACFVVLQQEFLLTITAASLLCLAVVAPALQPLAVLACCPVISLALGHYLKPIDDDIKGLSRWSAAMAGLFCLHWLLVTVPFGTSRGYAAVSIRGATAFLKAHGVRGRMFNEIESGALLAGVADRPVFVDGRAALYGPEFVRDAAGWPATFPGLADVYGFDYAVLLNRRAAYPARLLDGHADWKLAYADDTALVYARLSGASGALVKDAPQALPANRLFPSALDEALADPKRREAVFAALDRWILQAPDCVQAQIWKAYALDRVGRPESAERLLELARARRRSGRDPEIAAMLAFTLEARGRADLARPFYRRASWIARRRGDDALLAAIASRGAARP